MCPKWGFPIADEAGKEYEGKGLLGRVEWITAVGQQNTDILERAERTILG